MVKTWLGVFLITLFCICLALIPEAAMYFLWQVINPTETLEKIVTIALFWIGGAGLCVVFAFISTLLWISAMAVWVNN